MDWDALGAIAEAIGATAVIVTLVYLSLQLRNQNEVAKAQIHQQRADSVIQMIAGLDISDTGLSFLTELFANDFDAAQMNDMQRMRATLILSPIRANLENTYDQYKKGFISEEFYKDVGVPLCRTYGLAILRMNLPLTRSFRSELVKIVED
ncbi:MAG: hypothetical protein KUG75_15245 [Pseudomonadales bacterium]|nr:hypothetical protein [Pseudomonadales bacterium]